MAIVFAIIAVFTFANPDISALDFLPDFIGCLLLYFALAVPSEFSNKLSDARTLLFRLTLVTAADAVSSFFVSGDDRAMILLLSFCFGIAEAAMLYLLVDKIFDGMIYLGTQFPAKGIYMPYSERSMRRYREKLTRRLSRYAQHRGNGTITDEMINERVNTLSEKRNDKNLSKLVKLTKRFVIMRAVFNILPEFTELSSYGYEGEVNAYNVNLADFRGLFIVFAVFFTSIIALHWLLRILSYINGIRCDMPFREALRNAYKNDVAANTGLQHYKRLKLALVFLSAGVLLSLDFIIDRQNFIPDILCAVCVLLFWLSFLRDAKKPVIPIALTVGYGVFTMAHWISVASFIENYHDFTRTMKSEDAMRAYIVCAVISFVAEALFVLMMITVTRRINAVIHEYTGFISTGGEYDTYSEKLHARLSKQNRRMLILSIVNAAVSVAYSVIIGINKPVEAMQDGIKYVFYVPVFEGITTVMLIVSVIFAIYTVKHISDVSDGLDERYKLT